MLGLNVSRRARKGLGAPRTLYVGALVIGVALSASAARAQNATWSATPGSADFDTAGNWVPNTAVPTGIASFATSNTTSLTFSTAVTSINGFNFNTGANNFTFTIGAANTLNFNGTGTGAGIVVNGTSTVTINNNNGLNFNNASSAGGNTVTINNLNTDGFLTFANTSTAGSATINNSLITTFSDMSTAGSATINNNSNAALTFNGKSMAGSANITNNAGASLNFNTMSSAGSATITNNLNGSVGFNNNSTAGSANITNNQTVTFSDMSTAGSATINNNSNSKTLSTTVLNFTGNSDAGSATINNFASGFSNGSTGVIFQSSASANSATITNASGAGLFFLNTSTAGSAKITNNATTSVVGGAFLNGTVFENSSTAGTATITNNGDMIFEGSSSAGSGIANTAGANITNNGTLSFLNSSTGGSAGQGANITNASGATLNFGTSGGTDTSSAGSATITNNATLNFDAATTAGSASITNNGGSLGFFGTSTAGNATITNNNGGSTLIHSHASGGTARFILNGTGALDISDASTSSTTAGSIEGNGNVFLGSNTLTVGGNNRSTTFSGVIADVGGDTSAAPGSLTKVGAGTLILSGTNTYTGATTVSAGTLEVDGSIQTSSLATVAGGTLSGTGTLGNTAVNTGTLAPGNAANPTGALNVFGSLTFQSAALYMVGINGSTSATTTVVANTATLGGATVQVASGSTVTPGVKYTILTTVKGGTVSGTFNPVVTFGTLKGTLSYDPTDVFLTFAFPTLSPLLPPNAPTNVVNVANGIDNFVNGGGTLPPGFQNLTNLSPAQLVIALTQRDGEAATDAEKGAFTLMTQFLELMLDPFVDGRTGGLASSAGATGFAPEREASFPPDIALAYGGVLKAAPSGGGSGRGYDRRWTVWGAGFGGSNTTNGNATIGSNNVRASDFGYAVGADYHYSPDTVLGFALAGAGTNWGLAQGLGGGRSDAFMAGGYGITHFGAAYLAGDVAFANHWFTTNRNAGGDQLTARFNGQSYGVRAEAGYRYAMPVNTAIVGVTPYAAVQSQWFHTGGFNETDLTGGGFALAFNAMNANDTRSELGARFDELTTLGGMPVQLRGRVAWAHDWVTNPVLGAVFQALPGSAFTVNGAVPPKNSALTTAGAQFYLTPQLSFLAKFEGEFASNSQTYAGTGTLRYAW